MKEGCAMLKRYEELTEAQKEEARRLWPKDYEKRAYKTAGVLIEFAAK